MAVLVGTVGALSAFYHDALDLSDEEHRQNSAFRLIAKIPTITAMAFKYSLGQPFMYPKNELSYSANFMRMMFALPTENYKVNPVLVKLLIVYLFCILIMSKTHQHLRLGLLDLPVQILLLVSPRVLLVYGGKHMVVQMKHVLIC